MNTSVKVLLAMILMLILGIFIYKATTNKVEKQKSEPIEDTQEQANTEQYKTINFTLNDAKGKKFEYTMTVSSNASYEIYPDKSTDNSVAFSAVDIKLNPNTTLTINQGFSGFDEYERKLNLNFVAVLNEQLGMLYLVKNEPTQYNKFTTYSYTNQLKMKGVCTKTVDGKEIEAPCGTTIVTNKDRSYVAYFTCKLQNDNFDDMNLCNKVIVDMKIKEK